MTDRIGDIPFCPTKIAIDNLKKEGYNGMGIKKVLCGDVMYDAALYYKDKSTRPQGIQCREIFTLATIHRQKNTDNKSKLNSIFGALKEITKDEEVILPFHPRTTKRLRDFGIEIGKRIQILEPGDYFEMQWLLSNCSCVITDSGGVQKEAFFFQKPSITVREETEWVKLVKNKVNFLIELKKDQIITTYKNIRKSSINFARNLYGDGNTGQLIFKELKICKNTI